MAVSSIKKKQSPHLNAGYGGGLKLLAALNNNKQSPHLKGDIFSTCKFLESFSLFSRFFPDFLEQWDQKTEVLSQYRQFGTSCPV